MIESPRLRSELPFLRRLVAHVPAGQLIRFILVGVWNTLFGYASFALLTYLLEPRFPPFGYMIAAAIASVLNISLAFLGYKWFVFKTTGNTLREWVRCMVVYSSSIALGLVLLPILVFVIRHATHIDEKAPYVAAAALVCINALYNFVGNKKFTFRQPASEPPAGARGGIDS